MAFNLIPGPTKTLQIIVLALAAIWIANNVEMVNRLVRPRT